MTTHIDSLLCLRRTAALLGAALLTAIPAAALEPLSVVATTPELGNLVRVVGGDAVAVTVLAKPSEDPHFVEAKPSYVKALSRADLYVSNGLELEVGYAPVLLNNARNSRILPGGPGFVDASVVIAPLDVPSTTVDRSMGDVHPFGNPHYLLDPLMGLKVAALLRDVLTRLRPADGAAFAQRYDEFHRALGVALVGPQLAARYDVEKLAALFEYGKLLPFLQQQGQAAELGGWLGLLAPYPGARAVDDHPIWPYFARRFAVEIVAHLEPKPGVPPTTRHLQEVIETMRATKVPLIFAAAYYDQRHADFVASQTGARVVRLANQAGSRPGTEAYLEMVDYNVRQLAAALQGAGQE
ncbi:MAG: metal ABC transporter substrate-binding protein [Candidatus Binatia bacterium]